MVNVLANLNTTLCYDFIQDQTNILLLVSILSNSSKDENQHANIHVVSDDDESNWTSKKLASHKWVIINSRF